MLLFLMLAAITPVRATEVSYNANGATSGTVPAAQTKTQDVPLTLRANSGNLARPGYTFVGWNTAADGTGDSYAAGASYDRAPAQTTRHVVVASEAGFCLHGARADPENSHPPRRTARSATDLARSRAAHRLG
jgi:uncharacterized repeat protein (TIGR02543 family)